VLPLAYTLRLCTLIFAALLVIFPQRLTFLYFLYNYYLLAAFIVKNLNAATAILLFGYNFGHCNYVNILWDCPAVTTNVINLLFNLRLNVTKLWNACYTRAFSPPIHLLL